MPSTTYEVTGGEITETKSKKSSAVELAEKLADENRGVEFTVSTNSGTVVHTVTRKPAGSNAAPWTRVDESDKIADLEIPAGFTVAYVRTRIPAAVCRANDKSGWLIVTPEGNFEAKGTVDARLITNELGEKARVAREEAKASAKAEKARLREEAKAEKAAAAEQAEAEKAAAAEQAEAEQEVSAA